MPTTDERREVAERLRDYESLRGTFRESPICAFLDALGVGYLSWKGICNRLADLIEPEPERTCRIVSEEEIEIPDQDPWYGMLDTGITRYKLSCGHETLGPSYENPKRCSDCGARVKEGE